MDGGKDADKKIRRITTFQRIFVEKSERQWLTLKETWLYTLDISEIHSLAQFNTMLKITCEPTTPRFIPGSRQPPWNVTRTLRRL